MKIIKRNGSEAAFDITKIIVAIGKANETVDEAHTHDPYADTAHSGKRCVELRAARAFAKR